MSGVMPYAINIKCLNDSAAAIRRLWREAEAFEDRPSMSTLGYPPHITLGVYDADDAAAMIEVVEGAADWPAQRVTFGGVRHFDTSPLVLWAAPVPSEGLLQLHRAVHGRIDPAACWTHYRPGAWVPHCTLATRVAEPHRERALAWARKKRQPFTVHFDAADCVRFHPVEVLNERRLR